ncbi:hypothetical protein [Allohahella sp. A8]|uniref:hypothetical protein n=1 Tax=Allohahella sp. A8 TaxID=3141461 RepID=UPI003A80BB4A
MEGNIWGAKRDKLEKIRYLWKLDDPEWMRQRKADWKYIAANNLAGVSAKEKADWKRYFVLGEKEHYIGYLSAYFLTPFSSPESAHEVFWSDILDSTGRAMVETGYLDWAAEKGQGLPWLRSHLQSFVEGVLGQGYPLIRKDTPSSQSHHATLISRWFISRTKDLMSGELEYCAVAEAVDYHVSAFTFADPAELTATCDLEHYICLAKSVLKSETGRQCAYECAEQIVAKEDTIRANWSSLEHFVKGD